MDTVWVLTEQYNDYDQHGEYFLAVFKEKPDLEKLIKFMSEDEAIHVQNGGGRITTEYQWFYLREEELK